MSSLGSPAAYLRIAAELRDGIESGELAPGVPLPSERDLAERFGVSRMTARHAVMVLESEGSVVRRRPRGTFVAPPRLPMRIGSFSDEVARSGGEPGDRLLWVERQAATRSAAEALGLRVGAPVHAIQRLRTADGEAVAIETTYYPARLTPGLLGRPVAGSIWSILRERHGLVPRRAQARLEVVALDEQAAGLLVARIAAPGVLITRTTFDAGGRCFEYARDLYRADRLAFWIDAAIDE